MNRSKFLTMLSLISFASLFCLPPQSHSAEDNMDTLSINPLNRSFDAENLPLLSGIEIDPKNTYDIKFLFEYNGDQDAIQTLEVQSQLQKQIDYFLTALITPAEDLWVNLSPNEPDRILPDSLIRTELGVEMLLQDIELKKTVSKTLAPEAKLGRELWGQLKELQNNETAEIPATIVNRFWILPSNIDLFQDGDSLFVLNPQFQVLTEKEYAIRTAELRSQTPMELAIHDNPIQNQLDDMLRESVLPLIEQDVNASHRFRSLRQIYRAVVLAHSYRTVKHLKMPEDAPDDACQVVNPLLPDNNLVGDIYSVYSDGLEKGFFSSFMEDYHHSKQQFKSSMYHVGGMTLGNNGKATVVQAPQEDINKIIVIPTIIDLTKKVPGQELAIYEVRSTDDTVGGIDIFAGMNAVNDILLNEIPGWLKNTAITLYICEEDIGPIVPRPEIEARDSTENDITLR